MPRIVAISDTHSRHEKMPTLPDGDILIHAGDATGMGTVAEITAFNHWLGTLPHKHKILVAGNHDWLFETTPELAQSLITNAIYLQDKFVELEGLKIFGAPWQPRFFNWAFNVNRGVAIAQKWALIPYDTDVLITHGPPYGILDKVFDPWSDHVEAVGCEELLPVVQRIKPRVHIFGHIHAGYGSVEIDETQFVNASICTESYQSVNPPIVIDL